MQLQDESIQLLAAKAANKHLKRLSRKLQEIRSKSKDIEHLHQARVSARRLQSVLETFGECFPAKKTKKWNKRLTSLLKGLGTARDNDVQIESLKNILNALPEERKKCKAGIRRILLRIQQTRDKQEKQINKAIQQIETKGNLADIAGETARTLWLFQNKADSEPSETLYLRASSQIGLKIQALLIFESSLDKPKEIKAHHKMRIAAKKLRYTLELFRNSYQGKLDKPIKSIKKIQTLAGDMHDCDVWVDFIDIFEKQEHQRSLDYYGYDRQQYRLKPGLEYVREYYTQKRMDLFEQLGHYWRDLKNDSFWTNLQNLLKPQPKQISPPAATTQQSNEPHRMETPAHEQP